MPHDLPWDLKTEWAHMPNGRSRVVGRGKDGVVVYQGCEKGSPPTVRKRYYPAKVAEVDPEEMWSVADLHPSQVSQKFKMETPLEREVYFLERLKDAGIATPNYRGITHTPMGHRLLGMSREALVLDYLRPIHAGIVGYTSHFYNDHLLFANIQLPQTESFQQKIVPRIVDSLEDIKQAGMRPSHDVLANLLLDGSDDISFIDFTHWATNGDNAVLLVQKGHLHGGGYSPTSTRFTHFTDEGRERMVDQLVNGANPVRIEFYRKEFSRGNVVKYAADGDTYW